MRVSSHVVHAIEAVRVITTQPPLNFQLMVAESATSRESAATLVESIELGDLGDGGQSHEEPEPTEQADSGSHAAAESLQDTRLAEESSCGPVNTSNQASNETQTAENIPEGNTSEGR